MEMVAIVLASVDILISATLVFMVVFQEGNDKGLGVIGGGADTFFGKEKGRSRENVLKRLTTILAISFAVVTIVLFRIIAGGV
ncbi:MAG: preprotein translocase subunit SecG [Oscillospiraceae bacterium]|nr:preprotein translocase subunit SecG [Oscillospiraceae bacterium]